MPVEAIREHQRAAIDARNKAGAEAFAEERAAALKHWQKISSKITGRLEKADKGIAETDLAIMNALFSLPGLIAKRQEYLDDYNTAQADLNAAYKPYTKYTLGGPFKNRPRGLLPKRLAKHWHGDNREDLVALTKWAAGQVDAGFPGPMKTAEELIAWIQGLIPSPEVKETSPAVTSYINPPGTRFGMDDDEDGSRYAEGQRLLAEAKK